MKITLFSFILLVSLWAQAPVQPAPDIIPRVLRNYPPVTAQRLLKPEDGNWLMIWGGDSRGMQGNLNRVFPGEYPEFPEGGAVWVFVLP